MKLNQNVAILLIGIFSVSFITATFNMADKKKLFIFLQSREIDLTASKGSSVFGKALFIENMDHTTNVVITLRNTKKGSIYLSQINYGTIEHSGSMAIPLEVIKGTGSIAFQITFNIKSLINDSGKIVGVSYADLINFPGFVSVLLSSSPSNIPTAAGNIKTYNLPTRNMMYPENRAGI